MGRNTFNFDWIVISLFICTSLFGLLTIASTNPSLFTAQLMFIFFGFVVCLIMSKLEYRIFDHYWGVWYVFCLFLLCVTFLGPEIRGSTRWLVFGGIRIQPSELVKPLLIAVFAGFFSRFSAEKPRNLIIGAGLFLAPGLLLFKQPDLGNVLVYLSFFITMVFVSGISMRLFLFSIFSGVLLIPFSLRFLKEYQRLRLVTFLTPAHDPQGAGYNAVQALIAVGAGKLWGRGFGRGIQSHLRFLPEYHTDFISASFIEEFGLVGALALFACIFALLWLILQEAHRHAPNSFERLFCVGLFMQIFVQVVINIGMNIGIIPITGITLPLVSYGGSSIVATGIGIGILIAIRIKSKTDSALAIR